MSDVEPPAAAPSGPRRLLVTGGAGFIGSHLVDRLCADGHHVTVVDDLSSGSLANLTPARRNPDHQMTFVRHDAAGTGLERAIAKAQPEVVLHLAAQPSVPGSVTDPVRDAMSNVVGTVNVLEAARLHGVRKVVFAQSGGAIYGETPGDPASEDTPLRPASPYGAAKVAAETYLHAFHDVHGLRWTSLAIANVYGPRQLDEGEGAVVAAFVSGMLVDRSVRIHGDGQQVRDLCYIDDVVEAFVAAMDAGDGQRINIATGIPTTIAELADVVAEVTGCTRSPSHGPERVGDVRRSVLDPSLAGAVLGWRATTSLRQGLTATADWFRG